MSHSVTLYCEYDLEGAPLYSVKWYRDGDEFYRYVPKEEPPTRVFPLPGLRVDWLAYSKSEDSVYCRICVLFASKEVGMTSSQSTGQLITAGFSTWKKALERFDIHEACQFQKYATLRCDNFLKTMSGHQEFMDKSLDKAKTKQDEENRRKIKPNINTIILCGRQGIPLRGHKDYGPFDVDAEPQENEGNFRAILRTPIQAGDCDLKSHLATCGLSASYISWNMQSQIIAACGEIIKHKEQQK
nr:unnamed protein product [Callosobruchus analis]